MATPITWQNVHGPDLAAASRPLDAAGRSFTGAFDSLSSILSQHQNVEQQNWANTKNNNTNAFLDRLAAFATPEQLAAAQQSGELAQLRKSFGSQIDTAAIRGAEEQRLNQLRSGAKQAGEFQDWSTDRSQAGDVEKAKQLIANKDYAGAQALLDSKDLRQESVLWNALTQGKRATVVEGQQDTRFNNDQVRFGWDGQMQPLNLEAKRVDIAQGRQSMRESNARIEHMGEQTKATRGAAAAAAKLAASMGDKALLEEKTNGAYSLGAYGTQEGDKALIQAMKERGLDDGDRVDILHNLQKFYKDGITVVSPEGKKVKMPLPISAIVQAIDGSSDNPLAISSRRGDEAALLIAKRFGLQGSSFSFSNYDTPSRDYAKNVDKDLVNGMLYYRDTLNRRQVRAQEGQDTSDARAKDGKTKNPLK